MTSQFLIYGLVDPRTDEIRYIGKSCNGLTRPKAHGLPSCLKKDCGHKGNWIRQLQSEGLEYRIAILEESTRAIDLADLESYWIAQGKGIRWRLTNLTAGGEGIPGFKHTPKSIALMKLKAKGRTPSIKARTAASLALKGRARDRDAVEKTASALRGRERPRDVVERIAAKNRGRVAPNRGIPHSPETREKISRAKRTALTDSQTETVRGLLLEGRPVMEVARILGTRPSNVYNFKHRKLSAAGGA